MTVMAGWEGRHHETGDGHWPARQRTIVLQFDTVADAERWDAAGQPIWFPFPLYVAPTEDKQHESDDRQDDQDGPQHERTVPVVVVSQPEAFDELANLGRPQSRRRVSSAVTH